MSLKFSTLSIEISVIMFIMIKMYIKEISNLPKISQTDLLVFVWKKHFLTFVFAYDSLHHLYRNINEKH